MDKSDCIFCKIVRKEMDSFVLHEGSNVLAFLDILPFNTGHTIIVPKKHYYNFLDFNTSEMEEFFSAIQILAMKLKEKLKADGINIFSNNFPAAGQMINHMHFHIVPRWKNDKLPPLGKQKKNVTIEELKEIQMKILN